jgi:hypothetical protein
MSKRLQVLMPDSEMAEIQRLASSERITVGEFVRRTLREARLRRPVADPQTKLKAVRRAAEFAFPTAEIADMLDEIERGYRT